MTNETAYAASRRKAKAAFLEAKFESAIKLYNKAIQKHDSSKDPEDLEQVFTSMAVCYLGLHKYEEAIKMTDNAIKLNSSFSKAYYRKAEAKGNLKQFAEAQVLYNRCLMLETDEEARELIVLRKQVLALEERDERDRIYFRHLIPGEDICVSTTFNPITKVIFEIATQMRNIIYVLGDKSTGECMVVDPCWDVNGILKAVSKDGMRITGIIHTHNHFDHVGGKPPPPFASYHVTVPGAKKLLEGLPADAKVFIHKLDVDVYVEETGIDPERIVPTTDGQIIKIGNSQVKLMHTPGHTPGSQCIQFGDGRVLTGDTLFVGCCGRVDLPGGSIESLYNSLQKGLALLPNDTILYPAHLYGRLLTSVEVEKRKGALAPLSYHDWYHAIGHAQAACTNDQNQSCKQSPT